MATFHVPAHAEIGIIEANERRERHERFLRSWANDDRAINIAIRGEVIKGQMPGDAPIVLAAEEANLPLDDPQINQTLSESLNDARQEAGETWNGDPRMDDKFDWSWSPGTLMGETLQWFGRSPGRIAEEHTAEPVWTGVKGISRWFMLGADAGVDAVSDRIWRSAIDATREVGHIDWSNPVNKEGIIPSAVEWQYELYKEYLTGEDIGNKPFFGALSEAAQGHRVNLGSGFMPQSELAPDVQLQMDNVARGHEELAQHIYDAYEQRDDPNGWWRNNATYSSPYEEVLSRTTKAESRMLDQAVDLSADQAQLGKPVVAQSMAKQEAYGMSYKTPLAKSPDGWTNANHYSQVSGGRIIANVFSEPGTTPYHYISGTGDFLKQIFMDPLNLVGGEAASGLIEGTRAVRVTEEGAKVAAEAQRAAKLTEQVAKGGDEALEALKAMHEAPNIYQLDAISKLKKAGIDVSAENLEFIRTLDMSEDVATDGMLLTSRARKDIVPDKVNRYLTGAQAQPTVEALTEAKTMKQVNAVLSNVKGRISTDMMVGLRDAATEGEVVEILAQHIPSMNFYGAMRRSAALPSYSMRDMLSLRPLEDLAATPSFAARKALNTGFRAVDQSTNAILDRMYQVQQRGTKALFGMGEHVDMPLSGLNTRAQMRQLTGHTWIGRMVNNASNSMIRTDDIDRGYQQTRRLARNFGMEEDLVIGKSKKGAIFKGHTVEEVMAKAKEAGESLSKKNIYSVDDALYDFASLANGNGSGGYEAIRKLYKAAELKMIDDGIDPMLAREVTNVINQAADQSEFFVNAVGEVARYPGTGFMTVINGKSSIQPGPQLVQEMFHGAINVPDPMVLRRTLAEKTRFFIGVRSTINKLTTERIVGSVSLDIEELAHLHLGEAFKFTSKGTLEENALMRMARSFISQVWKPMKILRFGYIPKVVLGDEQGRMTAAGLASIWAPGRIGKGDSPLAYLTYMLTRKSTKDILDNPLRAAREFKETVVLHGNTYGEIGAVHSTSWGKARLGEANYSDGLATEINQLAEDPIVQYMFGDDAMRRNVTIEEPDMVPMAQAQSDWATSQESIEAVRSWSDEAGVQFGSAPDRVKNMTGDYSIATPYGDARITKNLDGTWDIAVPREISDAVPHDATGFKTLDEADAAVRETLSEAVFDLDRKSAEKMTAYEEAHGAFVRSQEAADEAVRAARNPDPVAATKAWLLGDPEGQRVLKVITDKIAEQDSTAARRFMEDGEMLDNYLQWVNARAHLKTGGDYIYKDVNTGTILDSSNMPLDPADYPDLPYGITITRNGHEDLLNSLSSGRFGADDLGEGGTKVRGLNDKDYATLRKELDKIVNDVMSDADNPLQFPEYVKHEKGGRGGASSGLVKKVFEGLMDLTVAKPAELLNREPAFRQFYWQAIARTIPSMTDELAEQVLKKAKNEHMYGRVKQIMEEIGEQPRVLTSLEDADLYAKSFAAEAVKDLLFDFAERKNIFGALSLISPFGDAWLELFTSWGRLFAKNPVMPRRPLKAYDELSRGTPGEWGKDEFDADDNGFFYQNEYGNEVFAIPFSGQVASTLSKAIPMAEGELPETNWEMPLQGLNMISAQLYPGIGPILSIPAASMIPNTPEFDGLRDFIAPFGMGDTSIEEAVNQTVGGSVSMRRFVNAFTKGKFYSGDDERIFNNTVGMMVDDMITSGEVTMEDLTDPDTNQAVQDEAVKRAQEIYLIRSFMQFMSPASPGQPKILFTPEEIDGLDGDAKVSAIAMQDAARSYYDILKNEADNDHKLATDIFTERYGFDPLITLVSKSDTDVKSHVSEAGYAWERANEDIYNQLPATAYYLRPDNPDDPFYYPAWEGQFSEKDRQARSTEDRLDEYQVRMASIEYKNVKTKLEEMLDSGEQKPPEGMSRSKFVKAVMDQARKDIQNRIPAYKERAPFTNEELIEAIGELQEWKDYDKLSNDPTQKAITKFFEEAWEPALAQQAKLRDGAYSSQLPFVDTGAKPVTSSGSPSESWIVRAAVNQALIEYGNELAQDPSSGNFSVVWDEILSKAIHDYMGDMEEKTEERNVNDEIDNEIERLFG